MWCTQAWAQKEALLLCAEHVPHDQVRISSLTVKSVLVRTDVLVHLVLTHSCRLRLQSTLVVDLVSPFVISRKGQKGPQRGLISSFHMKALLYGTDLFSVCPCISSAFSGFLIWSGIFAKNYVNFLFPSFFCLLLFLLAS